MALTLQQKQIIRGKYANGERVAHIAKEMGVSYNAVKCTVNAQYQKEQKERKMTEEERRERYPHLYTKEYQAKMRKKHLTCNKRKELLARKRAKTYATRNQETLEI